MSLFRPFGDDSGKANVYAATRATWFANPLGAPLSETTVRDAWGRISKQAGLAGVRFQDLRHTHATMLLADNVHPKIVSERLGHSTIGITLNTYSDVLPTMQRDAVSRMDELLDAPTRKASGTL